MTEKLAVQEQIATFTEAVSRAIFAATHGLQYGGDRDIYAVGGYPRSLTFSDFTDLYERDPIAGQVVDMPAEGTWRVPPEVNEKDADDDTPFSEAFAELADRLRLWGVFERADRMSRIGQYSVILIGTSGGSDQTLTQPLTRLGDPNAVLFLKPYNQSLATIRQWVTDPTNPRFGMPLSYDIDMSSNISGFMPGTLPRVEVDASRVIHIAEGLLNDDIFGRPSLQRIYNALHDLQKIETSTAEAFWQRVAGILTAKMDTQKDVAPLDATELKELDTALKELYHDLRRTFAGRGIELSRLAESEPNPGPASDLYFTLIAAGSAIPKRLLFGSETGERASTEDAKTYLGMISERQAQHAEPHILRPFIDRMIDVAVLPRPKNGYEVVWPTLFEESEKDQAEANKLRADAAKSLTPMGGDPIELIEIDDERNIWLVPRDAGEASPFEAIEPPQPPDGGQGPEPPPATPDAAGNVFDPNQPRVPAGSGDPSGEWVGGSGPMTAYHGTDADFDAFDAAKIGSSTDEGFLGRGFYFSTDPNIGRTNRRTMQVSLDIGNPLNLEMAKWGTDKRNLIRDALGLAHDSSADTVTSEILRQGFDSVRLDYSRLGYLHAEVVVFDPARVKIL